MWLYIHKIFLLLFVLIFLLHTLIKTTQHIAPVNTWSVIGIYTRRTIVDSVE